MSYQEKSGNPSFCSGQTPSWKIMDNKGRITVVLHWERDGGSLSLHGPSHQGSILQNFISADQFSDNLFNQNHGLHP
jgi:hypothetical protein